MWYDSARACRFVVAAAHHVKEDIIKYVGLSPDRVPVIPWGPLFEGETMPSMSFLEQTKKKYDLPDKFLLYPAMMWPHKNHIRLLEAIVRLQIEGTNLKLILTGGRGPEHENVMQFIRENNMEENVRFLGFISYEEMKAFYKLACGVVVPTLYEQTSGPVMEAMTLGCPVAASRVADLPELIADGCGLLFDATDVEDVARCVRHLWTQEDNCRQMAERAQRRIRVIRSWRSWANSYNELYEICAQESQSKKDRPARE